MLYFSEPYNISCALCHPLPEMYGFRPEMQRWNTGVSMAGRTQGQPIYYSSLFQGLLSSFAGSPT